MAGVYDPPYPIPYNPIQGTTSAPAGVMTVYNVKDNDAYGDGVHDDTAAWQSAATAIGNAGGGTLYGPPGTYKITKPILLSSNTTVLGTTGTVVSYTGSNATEGAFYTSGDGTVYGLYHDVTIRDIAINNYGSPAIYLAGVDRAIVENVVATCTGATYGLEEIFLNGCRYSKVFNNTSASSTGDGIFIGGCQKTALLGNTVINPQDDAIYVGANSTNVVGSQLITVASNVVYNGNTNGVRVECSTDVSVFANTLDTMDDFGIIVDSADVTSTTIPTKNVVVAGNVLDGCVEGGVQVSSQTATVSGIRISQNVIANSATSSGSSVYGGVILRNAAVVEGNTIIACGSAAQGTDAAGILLYTGANNATIRGNRIEDSPGWALVVWNGSGTVTYTGVLIESNDVRIGNSSLVNIQVRTGVTTRNNSGYNPVGSSVPGTAFALPASGTAWTNNTGVDGTLWVTAAGTVTDVVVQGVTVGSSLAVGQSFFVPAGGTFTLTYSATPTLVFVGN